MKLNTRLYSLKPLVFPEGFILVMDTREQLPLFTKPPKGLVIVRDTLTHGDYSIRGFEDCVAIERKQHNDLLAYVSSERKKSEIKWACMKELEFAGLVIEGSWEDVLSPSLYSNVSPMVTESTLTSLEVRYGIHIFCNRDRATLERKVLLWLLKFWKIKREV